MKARVFISFEYSDIDLKESLVAQAEDPKSPFEISDCSLDGSQPQQIWLSRAQTAITKCDIFVVILGLNTHQALGVLKEVQIARGLKKRRFQLRPQGTRPITIKGAGPVVNWTWRKLKTSFG